MFCRKLLKINYNWESDISSVGANWGHKNNLIRGLSVILQSNIVDNGIDQTALKLLGLKGISTREFDIDYISLNYLYDNRCHIGTLQ